MEINLLLFYFLVQIIVGFYQKTSKSSNLMNLAISLTCAVFTIIFKLVESAIQYTFKGASFDTTIATYVGGLLFQAFAVFLMVYLALYFSKFLNKNSVTKTSNL